MSPILTPEMLDQVIADSAKLEDCNGEENRQKYETRYKEPLEVVDENGMLLGAAPRGLVHRIGLRHSVVYCVVRDSMGDKWLLQTRGSGKLDISVGGHVRAGEKSYTEALAREFTEELGLSPDINRFQAVAVYDRDAELRPDRPLVRNRERRHVYSYTLAVEEQEILAKAFEQRDDRDAVLDFAWFNPAEVKDAVKAGRCADGLASSLPYL